MLKDHFHPYIKMSWRNKARLNICIAKDLADSFGGRKEDYLKRLNRNLRMRIALYTIHPFIFDKPILYSSVEHSDQIPPKIE